MPTGYHNGDIGRHVAENVARFRTAQGLSLSQLAARAAISKRTLSNVESGSNVTLETLVAIADGLGVELSELLFDGYTAPDGEVQVVRSTDVEPVDLGGRIVRHLCEHASVPSFTLSHVCLSPAASDRHDAAPAGVLYRLYVLRGSVTFGPLAAPVHLEAGDLATLRADQPHVLGSDADGAAVLLMAVNRR